MMAGQPLRCLVLLSVALHLCAAHPEVHPFTHLRHERAEVVPSKCAHGLLTLAIGGLCFHNLLAGILQILDG